MSTQLHTYEVCRSDEALYFNRASALAICDYQTQRILVSPQVTDSELPGLLSRARTLIMWHDLTAAFTPEGSPAPAAQEAIPQGRRKRGGRLFAADLHQNRVNTQWSRGPSLFDNSDE